MNNIQACAREIVKSGDDFLAIRRRNLVESKLENGLLFLTMWLVDVYNYDKEIMIFIFLLDIVMFIANSFSILKYTRL